MEVTREKIIEEISKTAFTDDENVKIADKLRALHLLNQIVKDSNKGENDSSFEADFLEDL